MGSQSSSSNFGEKEKAKREFPCYKYEVFERMLQVK